MGWVDDGKPRAFIVALTSAATVCLVLLFFPLYFFRLSSTGGGGKNEKMGAGRVHGSRAEEQPPRSEA